MHMHYYRAVIVTVALGLYLHLVSVKTCHFYFLNNFVKHWTILIIFGRQHHEETWRKWV